MLKAFRDGALHPLPQKVFPMDQARDAFRIMAQARHIGPTCHSLSRTSTHRCSDSIGCGLSGDWRIIGSRSAGRRVVRKMWRSPGHRYGSKRRHAASRRRFRNNAQAGNKSGCAVREMSRVRLTSSCATTSQALSAARHFSLRRSGGGCCLAATGLEAVPARDRDQAGRSRPFAPMQCALISWITS